MLSIRSVNTSCACLTCRAAASSLIFFLAATSPVNCTWVIPGFASTSRVSLKYLASNAPMPPPMTPPHNSELITSSCVGARPWSIIMRAVNSAPDKPAPCAARIAARVMVPAFARLPSGNAPVTTAAVNSPSPKSSDSPMSLRMFCAQRLPMPAPPPPPAIEPGIPPSAAPTIDPAILGATSVAINCAVSSHPGPSTRPAGSSQIG